MQSRSIASCRSRVISDVRRMLQRRCQQIDPGAEERNAGGELAVERRRHAAALRVAEDDDVLHLELQHREGERRAGAAMAAVGFEGRHDAGDVAHDEELAGARVEDGGGIGAASRCRR